MMWGVCEEHTARLRGKLWWSMVWKSWSTSPNLQWLRWCRDEHHTDENVCVGSLVSHIKLETQLYKIEMSWESVKSTCSLKKQSTHKIFPKNKNDDNQLANYWTSLITHIRHVDSNINIYDICGPLIRGSWGIKGVHSADSRTSVNKHTW